MIELGVWALLTQEIDGVNQIVRGGLNPVVEENYTGVIVTEEVYARQAHKLELVDGNREFRVKEGVELLTLEQLNNINEVIHTAEPVINLPVNETEVL